MKVFIVLAAVAALASKCYFNVSIFYIKDIIYFMLLIRIQL